MNQKNFIEIIRKLKQEIDTISSNIDSEKGSFSSIEVDLLLEKLRSAYDDLLKLKISVPADETPKPELKQQPEETTIPTQIDEEIHKSESETSEIDSDELLIDIGKKLPAMKHPVQDKQADLFSGQVQLPKKPIEEPEDLQKTSEKKKEQEIQKPDLTTERPEQKDKAEPEQETVVEKIQKTQQEETVADKIKKNKISSLKVAIGINEKFFFINELFTGSLKEYNTVIEDLDQKQDLQEALAYLESLQQKNMWDPASDAYNQLKQFLERKFL